MANKWLSWFMGKPQEERRDAVPPALTESGPADVDPVTGALRWDRFMAMFNAEQAQAPGVLLVIDLSERSKTLGLLGDTSDTIPWLAQAIRQAIRADDLLAHVHEHRFAVLLRGASEAVGEGVCDRIVQSVDDTIFMTAQGIAELNVKIGGVVFDSDSDADLYEEALNCLGEAQRTDRPAVLH